MITRVAGGDYVTDLVVTRVAGGYYVTWVVTTCHMCGNYHCVVARVAGVWCLCDMVSHHTSGYM